MEGACLTMSAPRWELDTYNHRGLSLPSEYSRFILTPDIKSHLFSIHGMVDSVEQIRYPKPTSLTTLNSIQSPFRSGSKHLGLAYRHLMSCLLQGLTVLAQVVQLLVNFLLGGCTGVPWEPHSQFARVNGPLI